jgi:hypothetical protein
MNLEMPIISYFFCKKIILLDKNQVEREIIEYSKKQQLDTILCTYQLVLELLKNNLFFEMSKDSSCFLLFKSLEWASEVDTKTRVKCKNCDDLKNSRKIQYFIKLEKEFIKSFFRNKDYNFNFDIELSKYLYMFFELSQQNKNK